MTAVREHRAAPSAAAVATISDLPAGTLALVARSVAEQHQAILVLQSLFARRGGIASIHFLSATHPSKEVKELEECRSFAVLNFSAITVQVGFGGSAATSGGGMPVAPQSYIQLPLETNLAELSAAAADLAAIPSAMVYFIRFRHLVNIAGGPLGGVRLTASAQTAASPGPVKVGNAWELVLAANAERGGLEIQNIGAEAITLGLGDEVANIVLEPKASWNGTLSGRLWTGAVHAISAKAGNELAVTEV